MKNLIYNLFTRSASSFDVLTDSPEKKSKKKIQDKRDFDFHPKRNVN